MKVVTIRTRQPNGQVVKKTTTPSKLPKKMTTFHYEGNKSGSWVIHFYMRTSWHCYNVVRYPLYPHQERWRVKQYRYTLSYTLDGTIKTEIHSTFPEDKLDELDAMEIFWTLEVTTEAAAKSRVWKGLYYWRLNWVIELKNEKMFDNFSPAR